MSFRRLPRPFRFPWRSREQIRTEVDEELAFHLDMRTEDLVQQGWDPVQARRQAEQEFGNMQSTVESLRDTDEGSERRERRAEAFGDIQRDVRFALRVLGKRRGFAVATVLTLAVGIGMATAMFSVTDGVLLRPLPIREQGEVAVVWAQDLTAGSDHLPLPYAVYPAFAEQNRSFADVAAIDYNGAFPRPVRIGDAATNLNAAFVTGNFFRVLGVEPEIGRGLQPEDDRVDATPVVVISRGLWERRFGGDPRVLGRTLWLVGHEATIVGVMPRGFDYPQKVEVWAPTFPFTTTRGADDSSWIFVHMVGRLAPGTTIQQAQSELNTFLGRDDAPLPPSLRGITSVVQSIEEHLLGQLRQLVWVLLGAVGLLLLITVVNIATLLLGRAMERGHEFGVRASLGATAGRIRLQLTMESLVLAFTGGLLGVAIAYGLVGAFIGLASPDLPRSDAVRIDPRALLFALAVSLGAALVCSLVPAIRLAHADLGSRLRTGSRWGTVTGDARLTQSVLVVGQVALALVVLAGAGLVGRSLLNLEHTDWGIAKESVLLAQFTSPDDVADIDEYRARVEGLVEAFEALPGVVSAAPTLMPPFGSTSGWDVKPAFEGQTPDEQMSNPILNLEVATPQYFRTLGIPLLRGRGVTEQDRQDAPPVVVISESVARLAWPGEDPIGRRARLEGADQPWRTVIGVVRDTRYRELTRVHPTVYLPRTQSQTNSIYLAIRTSVVPASLIADVRRAGDQSWPGVTFPSIRALSEYAAEPLARPRFTAALFSAFALVSLLLASIGLYGVLGAHVLQGTREIGIRMALGAERERVLRSVLQQGMRLALAGLGIGIAAALLLTRLLGSILYGVSPVDPRTFVAVAVLVAGISLLASYVPARRATRVDPMVVLRGD